MRRAPHLTILPREMASRIAEIMGHSSACAHALRVLDQMGEDAEKFEICQDGRGTILLMEKRFLGVEQGQEPK